MGATSSLLPADAGEDLQRLHARFVGTRDGRAADYIPELAKVDPDAFALAVCTVEGEMLAAGDADVPFTIQSISKPFAYGLALDLVGREAVHRKVGVEPTGEAFNSIVELEEEVHHRPYNPMINAGAITVSALLHEAAAADAWTRVAGMFAAFMGHAVRQDEAVMASELATGDRNRAIAHLLRHFGVLGDDIEGALRLYSAQCSVLVDTRDLAVMAATLANGGVHPLTGEAALKRDHLRDVLSLMLTCGMYDSSGEWAWSVGLPAKSGVSGGLLAVVPGRMGLAAFSPRLDARGHSVRGVAAFKEWAPHWGLGLFGR